MPASLIYAVGLLMYQSLHPLRPRRIEEGLPVIVVGNLTTGGTGKTPLVVWLVKALIGAGYRPAVISRGYGGIGRGSLSVLATTDAALAGDEAVMMAWVLDVPIVVDKDRRRGIAYLRENFDVNVLVSVHGAWEAVCCCPLGRFANLARGRRPLTLLSLTARQGRGKSK